MEEEGQASVPSFLITNRVDCSINGCALGCPLWYGLPCRLNWCFTEPLTGEGHTHYSNSYDAGNYRNLEVCHCHTMMGKRFTGFHILWMKDKAENYHKGVAVGEEVREIADFINREYEDVTEVKICYNNSVSQFLALGSR